MSTITLQDPLDALLTEATNGTSLLKDRNTLHFTHIPTLIHHRDIEQKSVAQSLLPILKQSRPSNLLVYGKPGTGILVVKKVLAKIQERVIKTKFTIKLLLCYFERRNNTLMLVNLWLVHYRVTTGHEKINSSTQPLQNAVSARSVSILRICSTV